MVILELTIQEATTLDAMLGAFINGLRVGITDGDIMSPTLKAEWHLDKLTIHHRPKPKEEDHE